MSLYVANEAEGRVPMCVVPAPRAKGWNGFLVNYSKTVISSVRRFGILGVITMGVNASREWASLPVFRCKWCLILSIGVRGTSEIGYVIGFQPPLGHRARSNRPTSVFVTQTTTVPHSRRAPYYVPRPPSTGDIPPEAPITQDSKDECH